MDVLVNWGVEGRLGWVAGGSMRARKEGALGAALGGMEGAALGGGVDTKMYLWEKENKERERKKRK